MRMSIPAYMTFGLITVGVIWSYFLNRNLSFLMAAIPGLLVLFGIPMLLTEMNRRHMDKIDMRSFRLYKIRELAGLSIGEPLRLRVTVDKVSMKWLNRPHFQVQDGSGEIGIFMFWSPRENIRQGDKIEVAGTLRFSGLSKKKNVFGIKMEKVEGMK